MILLRKESIAIDFPTGTFGYDDPIIETENSFGGIMATDINWTFDDESVVPNGTKWDMYFDGGTSLADMVNDTVTSPPSYRICTAFPSASLEVSRDLTAGGGDGLNYLSKNLSLFAAPAPLIYGAFKFWLDTDATTGAYLLVFSFYNRYIEKKGRQIA